MKRKMRGTALVLAGLMLLASTGCSSGGQTAATDEAEEGAWAPSGSIDFVCPYSAGGGSDIYARTLANVMSDGGYVDANIVVQNLSGGGGLVGTAYVYGKQGDNSTICTYAPGQLASAIANDSEYQWDDITQIAVLAYEDQTICTAAGAFESLDDLIAYSNEHPGEVTIGGCGVGNEDNVCALMLNEVAGANVTYVLYDSAGDILTAILGGHLTGGIFNPSECQAQLEAGGVDCLASFSAEPLENIQGFEEVTTCSELGYDIDFRMFRGLAGAPGMSDAALTYWQEVCRQVSEDPAWTEDYLLARGLTPAFIIGDDLTAFMEDQYETYYNAQKELGLI